MLILFDLTKRNIYFFLPWWTYHSWGDFNSSLGNKFKDSIISDSNDFLPIDNTLQTDSSSFTHRYIQDKNTNTSGKHLVDLCMINNLKILNGRKIGDLIGKYTCHHYNGSSTVDYIITEKDLFGKVRYFQVLPLTLFSDHSLIIANMDIKSINSKSKNTDQRNHFRLQATLNGT